MQPASNKHAVKPTKHNSDNEVPPPPEPLRRPRSPNTRLQTQHDRTRPQHDRTQPQHGRAQPQHDRTQPANFNKDKTRFVPPGYHPQPVRANQRAPYNRDNNQDGRRPQRQNNNNQDDEDWEAGKTSEKKPLPKPQASVPKISPLDLKVESPKPLKSESHFSGPKGQSQPAVTPPKALALVPAQYLVEKLPIGETFLVSVDQLAQDCATSQPGFVCLAMHADCQDLYNMLLTDIFESERPFKPQPGDTFAYLDPADGGWYRARCLSAARCALLDAGKVAPLSAVDQCRALANEYRAIPEFCCVLNGNAKISMSLKCTILMKTAEGYKVSIEDELQDNYLGEATVTRWTPEIELAASAQPIQEKVQSQPRQEVVKSPIQAAKPSSQAVYTPTQAVKPPAQAVNTPTPAANTPAQAVNTPTPAAKTPAQAVKAPTQAANSQAPQQPQLPVVPRPALIGGALYYLLHATSLARACVRPCDASAAAEFESVLQDTVLFGLQGAKQLTEPPLRGQLVLSLYEGNHYRALVVRTKAADNRYKVEYLEYGNEEIVSLEKLYSCPAELDLTARPTQASIIALSTIVSSELTPSAIEFLEPIKEQAELVATIPGGEKTAPSGSVVQLALAKNKESINSKLEEMCIPEWKKLEEGGKDVTESAVMMYDQMETQPLPLSRPFVFDITDFGNLESGVLCGYDRGAAKQAEYVFGPLTDKINEYCNSKLCNESYTPVMEELCLARLPPYPQWFRAVVIDHQAGQPTAAVLYIDYGNVEPSVPVANLRKIMPEFCAQPALAATADLKVPPRRVVIIARELQEPEIMRARVAMTNWPKPMTEVQILTAIELLKINEEGRGELSVKRANRMGDDMGYELEVPDFIAAIKAVQT